MTLDPWKWDRASQDGAVRHVRLHDDGQVAALIERAWHGAPWTWRVLDKNGETWASGRQPSPSLCQQKVDTALERMLWVTTTWHNQEPRYGVGTVSGC